MNDNDYLQSLRNNIKLSLLNCDKVLDDFSNLIFVEKNIIKCEKKCFELFNNVYQDNINNDLFDFSKLKNDIISCSDNCEEIYKRIIDHQIKGAEISHVFIFF